MNQELIISQNRLLCKNLGTSDNYCIYCINDGLINIRTSHLTIQKSIKFESTFDSTHFLINNRNSTLFNNLSYHLEPVSLSLFHRSLNSPSLNYYIPNEKITKFKNVSIHYIENDEDLLYKTYPDHIQRFYKHGQVSSVFKPDFSFTPELSFQYEANPISKLKWMRKLASIIGRTTPICLVYPGWYPKHIKKFYELTRELHPSAVGIYCGSDQKSKILLKNIKKIKELNPDVPLFAIGVKNPDEIREFYNLGARHFVISGWGNDGSSVKPLNASNGQLESEYESFKENCSCYYCSNEFTEYLSEKGIKRYIDPIQLSNHNIEAYKIFINSL